MSMIMNLSPNRLGGFYKRKIRYSILPHILFNGCQHLDESQDTLLYAMDSIAKLRHSVTQKKLQLQKEKLQMKLRFLLTSQVSCNIYFSW